MMIIFFIPLNVIALWETTLSKSTSNLLNGWYSFAQEGEEDNPDIQNPEIDDENGLTISRVPFSDLVRAFPNTQIVKSSKSLFIYILTVNFRAPIPIYLVRSNH